MATNCRQTWLGLAQNAAQVEALFSTAEADMVLRREIVAETGRSRLYINDELRSQDSLRDLRNRLWPIPASTPSKSCCNLPFRRACLRAALPAQSYSPNATTCSRAYRQTRPNALPC